MTSSTLIADGTYTIYNVRHPNYVINLSHGLPHAAINGWPSVPSPNLRWIVKNIGNNQITLEDVTARGYYAAVYTFSRGAPALASPNPTYWTLEKVSEGVYTIGAHGLQLSLSEAGKHVSIFLGPLHEHSAAEEQQWMFQGVVN